MNTPANLALPIGGAARLRKSRWPARLDVAQSLTGLALALFMWVHMMFVSSILISEDAMWTVAKFFEGYFIFGRAYPGLVSLVVGAVFVLFIAHAALALRKFPIDYAQYRTFRVHMGEMRHEDTTLWFWQVVTGFALFFLASVHLYQMLMHPADIDPYLSAERVWSARWWPLYLVLLFVVEIHAGIGLYRLAVKWGWFTGSNPANTRRNLKRLKWALTVFLLTLGLVTLAAYMRLGAAREGQPSERYVPTWQRSSINAPQPAAVQPPSQLPAGSVK
jgi:fumarate reductase subunit C